MTIKPSQINMYPRVSNWYETNFVEYRENSVFDKWHIEVAYFEADAEYAYGSDKKMIMGGAYQRKMHFLVKQLRLTLIDGLMILLQKSNMERLRCDKHKSED
jgi:hypothetical protein